MKKVGKGDLPPKMATEAMYCEALELNARKFEHALHKYRLAGADRAQLKADMSNHLLLMQSAANDIEVKGIHKQSQKLAGDYEQFIVNGNKENFAALEHDLQTLRDYNRIRS